MPIIVTVYGMPNTYFIAPADLDTFSEELKNAVLEIKELNLTKDKVSVLLPIDSRAESVASEITVFVEGLPEKPGNKDEFRYNLARMLGLITSSRFLRASVKCFVRLPEPKLGFWEQAKGIDAKEFEEG